jgi:ABC-type nitrate/sulfonate/bicarbonate transport system ATPase subunit
MHEVSDGERRRVQIVSGLMAPWDVLLLDEVSSFTFLLSFFLLLLALLLALL